MKLQKMVYFAQGIHLAIYHRPLITDAIQAWKFGPVIPELYQQYKLYGSLPITDFHALNKTYTDTELATLDADAQHVINLTWEALKDWDAIKLSNWTHAKGSPWEKYYKPGISDVIIPQAEMESYFKRYLIHA